MIYCSVKYVYAITYGSDYLLGYKVRIFIMIALIIIGWISLIVCVISPMPLLRPCETARGWRAAVEAISGFCVGTRVRAKELPDCFGGNAFAHPSSQ